MPVCNRRRSYVDVVVICVEECGHAGERRGVARPCLSYPTRIRHQENSPKIHPSAEYEYGAVKCEGLGGPMTAVFAVSRPLPVHNQSVTESCA